MANSSTLKTGGPHGFDRLLIARVKRQNTSIRVGIDNLLPVVWSISLWAWAIATYSEATVSTEFYSPSHWWVGAKSTNYPLRGFETLDSLRLRLPA